MPDVLKDGAGHSHTQDEGALERLDDIEQLTTLEFLKYLFSLEIELSARQGKLQVDAPAGVLSKELQDQVRRRKPDLLDYLAGTQFAGEKTTAPLSYAQQRLWLLDNVAPGSATYNIPQSWLVNAAIDMAVMRRAIELLLERHDSLRSRFAYRDGELIQIVLNRVDVPLVFTDLSSEESVDLRHQTIERIQIEEGQQIFDLSVAPLIRFHIFKKAEEQFVFFYNIHHIVADQQSLNILKRDLSELYRGLLTGSAPNLPPLSLNYADIARGQRSGKFSQRYQAELEYWRGRLKGVPTLLELPFSRTRPALITYAGARLRLTVEASLAANLRQLALTANTSLYLLMLTIFATLIYRYTGQKDLCIGTPVSGRKKREEEDVVGIFVNMIPLRCQVNAERNILELAALVGSTVLGDFECSDIPFQELVVELQPERSQSFSPLFQIMFALNAKRAGIEELEEEVDLGTSKYDLSLQISEQSQSFELYFEYRSDLFSSEDVRSFGMHFIQLCESLVNYRDQAVGSIALVNGEEEKQFAVWNQTEISISPEATLVSLFDRQVKLCSDLVAVQCNAGSLSYLELDRRSSQLAALLTLKKIKTGDYVAVCLERTSELIIALLAVLKAGAAYVPLDPKYPIERLEYMLSDSGARILITSRGERTAATIAYSGSLEIVFVEDAIGHSAQDERGDNALPRAGAIAPSYPAYLIYTSGSTGKPKGTVVEHRNAVSLLTWAAQYFDRPSLRVVLASTSVCFDLSIFEIFLPLSTGNKMVLVDDVLDFSKSRFANEVTLVNTVPSAMRALLLAGFPSTVKTVCLAGEFLPPDLVDQVYSAGVPNVFDLYGPTETTTYSTVARRVAGSAATIGGPIGNTQIHLLDENLQRVPRGALGELFVGGSGVTRGYLNRPELTEERFISLSSIDREGRLYRTGDLAIQSADGSLVYRGRRDQQVKIRGYRVELEEIESVLREISGAGLVAVFLQQRENGDALCAAIEKGHSELNEALAVSEMTAVLRQRLPAYMVPSTVLFVNTLPLTLNGKIDRKALDAIFRLTSTRMEQPPSDLLEQWIANIFALRLRRVSVSVDDHFFDDLDGHSLVAFEIFVEIEKRLSVALGLAALFQAPTVRLLSAMIQKKDWRRLNAIQMLRAASGNDLHSGSGAMPALTSPVIYILGDGLSGKLASWVGISSARVMAVGILPSTSLELTTQLSGVVEEIRLLEATRPALRIVARSSRSEQGRRLKSGLIDAGFSEVTVDLVD